MRIFDLAFVYIRSDLVSSVITSLAVSRAGRFKKQQQSRRYRTEKARNRRRGREEKGVSRVRRLRFRINRRNKEADREGTKRERNHRKRGEDEETKWAG